MLSLLQSRFFHRTVSPTDPLQSAGEAFPKATAQATAAQTLADAFDQVEESTVMRTLGWVSAGLGAVALGLVVGRELRQRYKFNRRTPYDFYAHSGDEIHDMEFGVGI